MQGKRRKKGEQPLQVSVKHVLAADAEECLSRAFALILKAAARAREEGEAPEGTALEEAAQEGQDGTGPSQESGHGA